MGAGSHRRANTGRHAPQEGEAGIRRQRAVRLPASRRQTPRRAGAGRAGHLGTDSAAPEGRQIAAQNSRPVEPAGDPDPARLTLEARIRRPAPEGGLTLDLNRIIQHLKAERDVLAAAIECLERLAETSRGKRRGRPPKWLNAKAKVRQPGNADAPT